MTGHRKTRLLLYDYLRGTAGADDERAVGEHLASCAGCAAEAESLRAFLRVAPDGSKKPSASLDDAYWSRFADEVAGRIGEEAVAAPGLFERLLGLLGLDRISRKSGGVSTGISGGFSAGFPSLVPRFSPAFAALAVAVIVFFFVLPRTMERDDTETMVSEPETATEVVTEVPADSATAFDQRLYDYFKRSKALLVGVSNMDPAEGRAIDLETERRVSRALLREARYLRTGPIDPRSYRLLSDLDQIMIGLANSDAGHAQPAVDIIRDGIGEKNLLFKLRIQETAEYRTPIVQASFKQ